MSLTLVILSWNAHRTLRNTLETYKAFGLDNLATERLIYFQELSQADKEIARKYNYKYIGSSNNIGIAAAYKELVKNVTSDLFLFLENDWVLLEPAKVAIEDGKHLLDSHIADVVRYRSRRFPGAPLWTLQYRDKEHERPEFLLDSIHWTDPSRFEEITDLKLADHNGERTWYVTSAKFANWTNNPTMFRTDWFKEWIVPRIGTRDVEVDIQEWWREQNFPVVQSDGLFTHQRIG